MHHDNPYTRRSFLATAGAATAGLAWTTGTLASLAEAAAAAVASAAPFAVLSDDDARDLAAIASRIIPTTDTPGATEAGVVHFFDQAFAGEMADNLPFALAELGKLNERVNGRFADFDADTQDEALHAIEDGDFFQLVRVMTIYGFFAMSRYGGNRNNVGWKLIGFEGHHGPWAYPFGHYDAEATRETQDD